MSRTSHRDTAVPHDPHLPSWHPLSLSAPVRVEIKIRGLGSTL